MAEEKHNPIRFGIIGCANIARKLARAITLAPNATVIAVGSRSADKARQFVADNGLPETTRVYGSYEGVLDDPSVDAVYLPLPTSLHVQWAVAAAEQGKHVLLEKPTALCAADLEVILAACESKGVQFMDSTMWMHHPRTAKMKELISDPTLFGQLSTASRCTRIMIHNGITRHLNIIKVMCDMHEENHVFSRPAWTNGKDACAVANTWCLHDKTLEVTVYVVGWCRT